MSNKNHNADVAKSTFKVGYYDRKGQLNFSQPPNANWAPTSLLRSQIRTIYECSTVLIRQSSYGKLQGSCCRHLAVVVVAAAAAYLRPLRPVSCSRGGKSSSTCSIPIARVATFGGPTGGRLAGLLTSTELADLGRLSTVSFLISVLIPFLVSVLALPLFLGCFGAGPGVGVQSVESEGSSG